MHRGCVCACDCVEEGSIFFVGLFLMEQKQCLMGQILP